MTDIVERLQMAMDMEPEVHSFEAMRDANVEIERLKREVEEWRERWAAERRDHEATIRHFDKLMNEDTA